MRLAGAFTTATLAVAPVASPPTWLMDTDRAPAVVRATEKLRAPASAMLNVVSAGRVAFGSVELKWIVPVKSVTALPRLSTAVTVGVSSAPATVDDGMRARTRRAAGPCCTSVEVEPATEGRTVSLADRDRETAVQGSRVTTVRQ